MLSAAAAASSGAPSGSTLSLTPAYPFPVDVGDDGCSKAPASPRDPKQCAAPLASRPRGPMNISAPIPKADCERVMADIRGYCRSQMPLGDLDLESFVCMYDPACSAVLCAIRSSGCCPFHCAERCLPSCPDDSPPPPPPRPPPPPPSPPQPPSPPPPSPPPPPPPSPPPPSMENNSPDLRVEKVPLPPPSPPSSAVRPTCLGGIYLLDVARSEALLSQLRKWCYFYTSVNNQTDSTGALNRSTASLRLSPGPSQDEWELSPLLRSFCEQNGAMPDNMNRGDGWAVEEECSAVLKVLAIRFGGDVCTGACAPWMQPCPSPPPPPSPPPMPCSAARGFGNGNEAADPVGCSDSTIMQQGRAASAPTRPPSSGMPPSKTSASSRATLEEAPEPEPEGMRPVKELSEVEQESEEWPHVAEPTGLNAHAALADRLRTIEQGSHRNGPPLVSKHKL